LPLDVDAADIDLNGAPTLIDTDGARVHSVFAIANPDKLEAIA
jgi:hypothetical protein